MAPFNAIPVYVISLNDNISLDFIRKEGFDDVKLVKGIRGKNLTFEERKRHCSNFYANYGTASSIGCTLSHLECWKIIANSDAPFGIVYEDDVVFEKEFKEIFESVLDVLPKDTDLLYLGYLRSFIHQFVYTLSGKIAKKKYINKYLSQEPFFLATHAYMLSKEGARKLICALDGKISGPVDEELLNQTIKNKINTYHITPRIAYQTSTDNMQSNNVATAQPYLISKLASYWEMDTKARFNYVLSTGLLEYRSITITLISILLIVTSLICKIKKIKLKTVLKVFLLISVFDIPNLNKNNIYQFIFHLFCITSAYSFNSTRFFFL